MRQAFGYIHRVRTSGHRLPGVYWQNKIGSLSQQLHITRAVTMLESGITKIPVVIGHLRPVIYMPLGLLANLPPDQVEAVLLHELAHIRRNDYLVNLLQNVAETIFFFNPGLLWVSSLLKQEREHCCDDVALAHTGDKKQFIQALINFKEHVIYGSSHAMAFPGKKSHLLQRVARIVYNRNNSLSGGEKIFLVGSLLLCFTLLGTMAGKHTPALTVSGPAKEIYAVTSEPQNPAQPLAKAKGKSVTTQKRNTTPPGKITERTPVREASINLQSSLQQTAQVGEQQADADNRAEMERDRRLELDSRQIEMDRQRAVRDREQAERDRAQADHDRAHADYDRQMAEQHRIQAGRDRQQADRDREQATKDHEQAERDRAQAAKDRLQAEENRRQADRDRKQFDQKRIQQHRTNTRAPRYINP